MSKEQLFDRDGNPVHIEQKKRGGCLKWLLIAVGVIVLLGACGAMLGGNDDNKEKESANETAETNENTKKEEKEENNSEENEEVKEEYAIGETFDHNGVSVTVNEVERIEPGELDFLDEGDNYIRINLTINNNSDKEVPYNPLNFEIQTSDGNVMDSFTFPPSNSDKVMTSGKLTQGGTYTGNLFYEVPADDNGLILRYEPSFWSNEIIKFNVNN